MNIEQGRRYVRAVWPNAQTNYDEYIANGHHPNNAAEHALNDHNISWSHSEALDAAGIEREDY